MDMTCKGLAFPKAGTAARIEARVKASRADLKALQKAKDAAWVACGGRCVTCHKRIERGSLLGERAAHFHHSRARSLTKGHAGEYRCYKCHFPGPSGAHARSRKR